SWEYPQLADCGYVDRKRYEFWAARDPISIYAGRLVGLGLIQEGDLDRLKAEAESMVAREAAAIVEAPWPDPSRAGQDVVAREAARVHVEVLDPNVRFRSRGVSPQNRPEPDARSGFELTPDPGPSFAAGGSTYLEGVMLGIADALRTDERVF